TVLARLTPFSTLSNLSISRPTRMLWHGVSQLRVRTQRGARSRLCATKRNNMKPSLSSTAVGYCQGCTVFAVTVMVIAVLMYSSADAAPVAVRFLEGVAHGYFIVRSLAGETIGQGELTQVLKDENLVESQVVIHFKDGSLYDEKVAFSQQRVFTIVRYHLVQRGPAFPDQIDVSIDRGTAEYKVRSLAGKDGKEKLLTGHFDLPNDVYNGMFVVMLKNLFKEANATVNFLAFTPSPQLIPLQLRF